MSLVLNLSMDLYSVNMKKIGLTASVLCLSLSAQAERIEFTNGDRLEVEITQQTETTLSFTHPIFGEQSIDKSQISNIAALNLTTVEVEPADTGVFGSGFLIDWNREIEFGLTGASGSTNNMKFRTAFNTNYEDDRGKWDFKSFYLYSADESTATENKFNMGLVKDWYFKNTSWFGFVSTVYDWDQFRDWEHRLQVSVGPAYKILKSDEFDISARMGGTGIFEFGTKIDNPNNTADFSPDVEGTYITKDTQNFEIMLGLDFAWQINETQTLSAFNYIYPGVTDAGEFRNVTNLTWAYDLDFLKGLALKLGLRNEYDTSETDANDLKYNASLGFRF